MASEILNIYTPIVSLPQARSFISRCMEAAGAPKCHAETLALSLIEADYRGHYSHGMNRLDMYVNDVLGGLLDAKALPSVIKETPATAWVNGNNGFGAVVGKYCMDLAIQKAKEVGIGMVVAKESNHFGIAGSYSLQALKEGFLGFTFTNGSPFMAPTRAKASALGTNPLALGAPAANGDSFLLDMATTAVAAGKIEMQLRKNEPIPDGWAQGPDGNTTTDTALAHKTKRLMPLGGSELTSGYKGYGLGLLVDILSGILGGSLYGPYVPQWGECGVKANIGQCFIAIDPDVFAPGFQDRLSDLLDYLRNMEPIDSEKPVVVAGDLERNHMESVDSNGGLRYVENQWKTCKELSKKLKIDNLI